MDMRNALKKFGSIALGTGLQLLLFTAFITHSWPFILFACAVCIATYTIANVMDANQLAYQDATVKAHYKRYMQMPDGVDKALEKDKIDEITGPFVKASLINGLVRGVIECAIAAGSLWVFGVSSLTYAGLRVAGMDALSVTLRTSVTPFLAAVVERVAIRQLLGDVTGKVVEASLKSSYPIINNKGEVEDAYYISPVISKLIGVDGFTLASDKKGFEQRLREEDHVLQLQTVAARR